FSWKINDEAGKFFGPQTNNKHLSHANFSMLASLAVSFVVFRERPFKLKRKPLAHHADGVDRIHYRLAWRCQQIAAYFLDHCEMLTHSRGYRICWAAE